MSIKVKTEELLPVLSSFNPWWRGEPIQGLPGWKRAVYAELRQWMLTPPTRRVILLTGARQVGKTTLLRQLVTDLLASGVPASNILYASFDHPLLKLAGPDAVLTAWREREPQQPGPEYLLLDEAQFIPNWGTWAKLQNDFEPNRRILATGSALQLAAQDPESAVGRIHTVRLNTLSFYEYLKLKQVALPPLPAVKSLKELFAWEAPQFKRTAELLPQYVAHFHEYLLRGGFPQTALIDNLTVAQALLREDIVDKVLKRDMTALFGVRRILELELTFLYLCRTEGGLLDMQELCENLALNRQTVQNFIELLEATHLVRRLMPHGYGKEVLRGRQKLYLTDPAIAPAVLMRDKSLLEDPTALGITTESAVLKHLTTHYYRQNVHFSYWKNAKGLEVDLIAERGTEIIPFEVKYRQSHTLAQDLKGLAAFGEKYQVERGYVITRRPDDLSILTLPKAAQMQLLKIPAPLLCYWMGEMELNSAN